MNTGPGWATPAGFLFTATENVSTAIALVTIGSSVTSNVIVGELPEGLQLSIHGNITGTPGPVQNKTRSKFVVRASNASGISDRTFFIDVDGRTNPYFTNTDVTISNQNTYLNIGPNGESWALNRQYVNFSLNAGADPALTPANTTFKYYIKDAAGQLPPGLSLSTEGVISGFLNDTLSSEDLPSVPKKYQFGVTVTDGVASTSSNFNILVVNTEIIRSPGEFLPNLDPGILTTNTTYMPPLQFLKGTDLGIIRAQNEIILDVSAYDPYPEIPYAVYFLGTNTTLPPYLTMDYSTGKLYGYIPYQPAYTKNYNLEVFAKRFQVTTNLGPENTDLDTFTSTEISTITSNIFSLSIKGDVDAVIQWVSTASLGDIVIGETSELAVVAENVGSDYTINYNLVGGSLPLGLNLEQDGSISGKVDYSESTGTYTITVSARDAFALSEIEKTFTLTVSRYNNKKYTEIYCRPFFTKEKREVYQQFISDKFIFDPALMYRYFDPNFGVQTNIKMVLEFGIEQINLEDYFTALQENFYRRKLYFGDIKSAIARDNQGNVIYEVVYSDIVDELMIGEDKFLPQSITMNNETYYPGSIENQRVRLSQLQTAPSEYVDINEYMMPRYMRTAQIGEYQNLNYISVVPLCYTLPGNSSKVISRIKQNKFDFKQFDFDVDRIIVQNSLNEPTAKYLILSKQSLSDS
jgi:hypothetical protein